jgi:hypothetical protein
MNRVSGSGHGQPGAGRSRILDQRGPASRGEGQADAEAAAPQDAGAPARDLPAGTPGRRAWLRSAAAHPAARHVALLALFLAAGIAVTWPRAAYLTGRLPALLDVSSYVWDLWWVAHQVTHLGNPWFTGQMAAPVGIQLGFDTIMPLAGLLLAPITLAFGPSAAFTLLTIAVPGLACYVMYRAARLWLRSDAGAIAAGALFGLSTMLSIQDWIHVNLAVGTLFLPMTLEASVRLRRSPGRRQAMILGLATGAAVLVNQESAVMAVILAGLVLGPGLLRRPSAARLPAVGLSALIALLIASPQLIAMAQQVLSHGASASAKALASGYVGYSSGLPALFAPSPRVADFGLASLASIFHVRTPSEGLPTFGLVLSLLAALGLAATWRRHSARLLGLLWLGCGALALGSTLWLGSRQYVPLAQRWQGVRVSLIMPFTWFTRIPGMSAQREAGRFALLGLVAAALLAGSAVDWLRCHARPLAVTLLALAVLEAGWSGNPSVGVMPTAMTALDRPIAADHSGSIVVDVPFGLRGGVGPGLYGGQISPRSLLVATADGHPRAVSYTSWVPAPTMAGIRKHAFYSRLAAAQRGRPSSAAQLAAARRDAWRLDIGWVLLWSTSKLVSRQLAARGYRNRKIIRYLAATGFRFGYRADGVSVYRPGQAVLPAGAGGVQRGQRRRDAAPVAA